MNSQVKEYDTNPIASPVRPTYESWEDEILGLDDPVPYSNGGDSVDDEINAYYSDPRFGLSMLNYWEASMNRPTLSSMTMLNFHIEKPDALPKNICIGTRHSANSGISGSVRASIFLQCRDRHATTQSHSPRAHGSTTNIKVFLKQGNSLGFTSGMSKDTEIEWLEGLVREQGAVPEDITTFIASLLADE
jgi:hypothetical protein